MTRQRRAENLLKTFGEKRRKKKKRFDDIYIHGVGKMFPLRHEHACCSHIMVYATKTVKTAHKKAKKHSHTLIYTKFCADMHTNSHRGTGLC